MWSQFAFGTVLFFCFCLRFPNKPPSDPSVSASVKRHDLLEGVSGCLSFARCENESGFLQVKGNFSFWCCACAYGAITGVFSGWSAYLLPNLEVPPFLFVVFVNQVAFCVRKASAVIS